MGKYTKYILIYILVYFIVDFGTGFNWDVNYWLSVNGPLLGAFLYSLSGLFFAFLIFRKNIAGKTLLVIASLYGVVLEIFVFKNPLMSFPAIFLAVPLAMIFYSLIVFTPKWIVEKSVGRNLKKLIPMLIIWSAVALLSFFNNSHTV